MDKCGNRSTCVQRITVRDTTAPAFQEAQVLQVVDAGAAGNMEAPVATDGCGGVIVRIHSVETNLTASGSQMITYVWEAIDESGNTTLFSRNIEILPVILPDPELAIGWKDGRLTLSWPAQPAGWWLESTTSLLKPDWKPVGFTPVLTNNLYVVEPNSSGPSQWFRLATGTPPLALASAKPGIVALAWPSLATGYTVERCSDLAGGIWTAQPAAAVITNGHNRIEFDASGARGFFRLTKPAP